MTVEPAVTTDPGNGTPPPADLDLLKAEVAAESKPRDDLPEGAVLVPLHNRAGEVVATFAVLHPDDWPCSAAEDVNNTVMPRIFTWALKVLATEDDRNLWRAIDPSNRAASQFIEDWQRASGNDPKGRHS